MKYKIFKTFKINIYIKPILDKYEKNDSKYIIFNLSNLNGLIFPDFCKFTI